MLVADRLKIKKSFERQAPAHSCGSSVSGSEREGRKEGWEAEKEGHNLTH